MNVTSVVRPERIERLAMAVYPSFALLAGMELDVFTTLKDGPLTGLQVAATLGVEPIRLNPLLYALVASGLLTLDGERFNNTPEASQFLVGGRPDYIGMRHHAYRRRWQTVLRTAESIRTGVSEAPRVYAEMSAEERAHTIWDCTPRHSRPGVRSQHARNSRVTAASWTSAADPAVSPSRWRKLGPNFL
jgi:hypothetical protein